MIKYEEKFTVRSSAIKAVTYSQSGGADSVIVHTDFGNYQKVDRPHMDADEKTALEVYQFLTHMIKLPCFITLYIDYNHQLFSDYCFDD